MLAKLRHIIANLIKQELSTTFVMCRSNFHEHIYSANTAQNIKMHERSELFIFCKTSMRSEASKSKLKGDIMPLCKHCSKEFSLPIVALHEERCKENPKNKPKPKKKPAVKKTADKTSDKK